MPGSRNSTGHARNIIVEFSLPGMDKDQILSIKKEAIEEIQKARSSEELFVLQKKYLGRKSEFNQVLKSLKNLSPEEKREMGPLANNTKRELQEIFSRAEKALKSMKFDPKKEKIDITMPGAKKQPGHLHILSQVQNDIDDIFTSMGFEIADGPEVETEWYNFDALNIPKDHPARDFWDTFWLKSQKVKSEKSEGKSSRLLLRTHTSPVQMRYMQKNKPPFRIIVPGKCFRKEATDASHEHTFYQFEALMVGDDISVGTLKYVAQQFFSSFFGKEVKVRLRPCFFPFTEPSFEFDISCTVCNGKGCPSCGGTGWLEMGGAGMVNQKVFEAAGYKRNQYQGLAWGFGLERLAMMKYKIDDIRLFHSGDLRFVKQF